MLLVMSQDDARTRLGRYVRRRRLELGLSIDEARAAGGGMSATTWSRVEKGLKVRDLTYGGVDQALKWITGSSDETLAGGEPTPIEAREVADSTHAADELTAERELSAREIADRMTELANWIKTDRERERQEYEERLRRLEEEVKELRNRQSG